MFGFTKSILSLSSESFDCSKQASELIPSTLFGVELFDCPSSTMKTAFTMTWVGSIATILLCRHVEAIRSSTLSAQIDSQCDENTQTVEAHALASNMESRPQQGGAPPSGLTPRLSPRPPAIPMLSPRPAAGPSWPTYPQLTVPQLYQPVPTGGVPIMQYGPSSSAGLQPPRLEVPLGTPAIMRPTRDMVRHGPGFASILLTDQEGHVLDPPRYLVVSLDRHGRPAGVPLFQDNSGAAQVSGFLGAAAPVGTPHGQPTNPVGAVLRPTTEEDRVGWQIAEGVETAMGIGDIGFVAHAAYQVEEATRHGQNVAEVVKNVDPGTIDAVGHWAKAHQLLPATKNQSSILAGTANGGAHITAGVGVAFSGLSLAVNGRQLYVSYQVRRRADERRDEIWEVSDRMTDDEYDAAMTQMDAVVEHNARTAGLAAGGAAAAGIGGTVGVMVLAGSAPVWAPPAAFGAAIGGAGIGIVSLGRMWFDPKPEMPDVPDNSSSASSLLDVALNTDVNASSFLGGTTTEPFNPKEKVEIAQAYLAQIVVPTWSAIFAKKHNVIPFYIDLLWRELRKKFGMDMEFIQIVDNTGILGSLPSIFQKALSRGLLIELLQELDHPGKKLFWVSNAGDLQKIEGRSAVKTAMRGYTPDFIHESLYSPIKDDTFRDEEKRTCWNRGPSPDTHCEKNFGPNWRCQIQIDRSTGKVTGNGRCEEHYPEGPFETLVRNHGIVAFMGGGSLGGESGTLMMVAEDDDLFKKYWTSLHGFGDRDWEETTEEESTEDHVRVGSSSQSVDQIVG